MFYFNHRLTRTLPFVAALVSALLVGAFSFVSAEDSSSTNDMVHKTGMTHQDSPGWAEKLKGQTIIENSVEGRAERAAMVEKQHDRLMEQMEKEMAHSPNGGGFNNMSKIHQYGGGPGNYLLSSDSAAEPIANNAGGRCPSTAPVKKYDISAINVEITPESVAGLLSWLYVCP